MVGRVKKTARQEQKEGMLYVDQPPRTEWIPSISPECLKFETWLRMMDIPYEHIDHESLTGSNNSQLPHCKVGGKEIPFSMNMSSEIAKAVNKESIETPTPPLDNGAQRAFQGLIEGSLHWVLIYMRATQANQLPPCDGFQGRFLQLLRPFANKVVANKLKTKADYQGIGRHNAADVLATGKEDLRAISAYLDKKEFMAGQQPNQLDATTFAHLSQFWFIPTDNELKTFIKEECPNLIDYIERMKVKFWPDWEEKCRKPAPPRRTKSKDETAAAQATDENKTEPAPESATPATNGHAEPENGEQVVKKEVIVSVSTVEVAVVQEDKPQAALENGHEDKHPEGTANGGTPTEKVAE